MRDRPWQHPEISSLYFSELGSVSGNRRPAGMIDYLLRMGADHTGGHFRVVKVASKPAWLEGHTVDWDYQDTLDREFEAQCENARRLEYEREQARRAPIYGFCDRCQTQTEQCKNPNHRGVRRCTRCSGGLGNHVDRFCLTAPTFPGESNASKRPGARLRM